MSIEWDSCSDVRQAGSTDQMDSITSEASWVFDISESMMTCMFEVVQKHIDDCSCFDPESAHYTRPNY